MRGRFIPYSLLILAFLTISSMLMTQPVIRRVEEEVRRTSRVIARLFSTLIISALSQEEVAHNLREILKEVDFPIIITDEMGIPRAWQRVGVDPKKFSPQELNNPILLKDDPDFKKLLWYIGRLGKIHKPMPIKKGEDIVGYLYYGYPPILDYLRVLPFLLMIVGILSFTGLFMAARSIQTYQLETLWTSFAKGLAHQMGTPVSSLFGWFELLKTQDVDPQILRGMERDLERLRSILSRFSRIGGGERLSPVDLGEMIENTVEESRARFLKGIDVELRLRDKVVVQGDRELLSWAVENLIKNAYEARKPANPRITIDLFREDGYAVIRVIDNGKGIPRDKRKFLFKKSFSTKERGWGMGLVLTRRIVEEVHKGRIRLIKSVPFSETVFEIRLPVL
ncbi:MAG: hypothetical protein DRQ06_03570 [Candidatus Hydrothermota bacterium]|uniref:histidine kinase n=1 Tax=candidate division WOR-3 bacterium TaxID=2052148 RepID=A0A7C1BGX8_UNCW3|nr:MAG: hypothetical protein DRQ06_03570 [Candidatus Hydrothermae bacterium]RKZ03967.1 MAG: hypothetical protein DRQ04_01600 [Candidatus Hydrothermae bacterium]HDM90312.1 HAMP domain-containing histidine kinase [candidate division WOR-3 bacterium]